MSYILTAGSVGICEQQTSIPGACLCSRNVHIPRVGVPPALVDVRGQGLTAALTSQNTALPVGARLSPNKSRSRAATWHQGSRHYAGAFFIWFARGTMLFICLRSTADWHAGGRSDHACIVLFARHVFVNLRCQSGLHIRMAGLRIHRCIYPAWRWCVISPARLLAAAPSRQLRTHAHQSRISRAGSPAAPATFTVFG